MKHYLIVLIACLFATFAQAQNPNTKWGKPSQTEWSLQAWGEAPDAEAVVLNRTMNVNYQISRQFAAVSDVNTELTISSIEFMGSNNENSNVTVTYENKLRIKILKDSGAGYANIDIVYLNEESDSKIYDEIDRLRVAVFSQNEKGKVKRRYLQNDTFTSDRVNAHYKVLHIKVPDVKKGDIIEYQYVLTSARPAFLYDCSFQEEIPVLYAKCDMDIPGFLQFDMKVPIHPFIKSKVSASVIHPESVMGDMQAPKSYPSNHYEIEGHDILPKGLDLQRNDPNVEPAKVSTAPVKDMKMAATIKGQAVKMLAPLPEGKSHIMINPK